MLISDRIANWKKIRESYFRFKDEENKKIPISLNDKVNEFIDWYSKNMVKGHYTDIGEYQQPIKMRDFIEKMAVWYELRYPDYEINRLMPGSQQENKDIDDIMFNSNNYINKSLDEDTEARILDWDEFYNAEAFISSLPGEERQIFEKPRYRSIVYVDLERGPAHLHLTPDGFVETSEGLGFYTQFRVQDTELLGMHVKEVIELLKSKKVILPKDNELQTTVNNVERWNYLREEMLNCVMYRIIERGGKRIGPRRAFLFAKEFGRDIDIPMIYGIDSTDPGLRIFIMEYLKAGGNECLVCYRNYFGRARKNEPVDTMTIREVMQLKQINGTIKYTPEETELHQRLVDVLASQVDEEEKAKQLRIQRHLEKSRQNNNHN